jgi:hypothetical protein
MSLMLRHLLTTTTSWVTGPLGEWWRQAQVDAAKGSVPTISTNVALNGGQFDTYN